MNEHERAQEVLYEFVKNELSDDARKQVEHHIASCKSCSEEVTSLTVFLRRVDGITENWSELQTPGYWNSFARSVEERINEEQRERRSIIERFGEWLDSVFTFRPRDIAIASAVCGVLVVALLAGKQYGVKPEEPAAPREARQVVPSVDSESVRLNEYFRKSRTLLLGLANLRFEEDEPVDINAERIISRHLLHEARLLKQRPLDSRSERLISDMEKILIKIANSEDMSHTPELELIRDGIERGNLLYKVRRAEAISKSPDVMFANDVQ